MSPTAQSALDTWYEFAAAVAFVADVERPQLTVWEALGEAMLEWLGLPRSDQTDTRAQPDPLRCVLRQVLESTPEVGAPGGVRLETILDAAVSDWIAIKSGEMNDGRPFYC